MFKRNVQKFIKENELLEDKDRILVALSGGADSVALIRVLLSLIHVNAHIVIFILEGKNPIGMKNLYALYVKNFLFHFMSFILRQKLMPKKTIYR